MSIWELQDRLVLNQQEAHRNLLRRTGRMIGHALHMLDTWNQRLRTRKALLLLDERMLQDIGISRVDAIAEASKPFWRA